MEEVLRRVGGQLPAKLRGKDDDGAESIGFIAHSVKGRLSAIMQAVPQCKEASIELSTGAFTVVDVPDDEDAPSWAQYVRDELEESGSNNCMSVGWFFLENYMYRYGLSLSGYWSKQSPGYRMDPWENSKLASLDMALPSFIEVCRNNPNPTLDHLIMCCLWGNRSDLSLSSGSPDSKVASGAAGRLLVDHLVAVKTYLDFQPTKKTIIIVLDNCGAELLADLRLALFLSATFRIVLHAKSHPVFVSDATPLNIEQHLDLLARKVRGQQDLTLVAQLRDRLNSGDISVLSDDFYTSPLEFPNAPRHLKDLYASACLVILKGDANYRRMLLDRYFPVDFPFGVLCRATTSTPVLAIRTCKSPVAVGISKSVAAEIETIDKNWCTNGTCGVLQFSLV